MEFTEGDTESSLKANENDPNVKIQKQKNPKTLQKMKDEKDRRKKKKARLIVRNISYKVTEETLKKHFGQWGTVEEVNLLKREDGKLVGCAFVQYASLNQAKKAILKGNNKALLGRPVNVDWALGKTDYTAKKKQAQPEKIAEHKAENLKQEEESEDQSIKSELESDDDENTDDSGANDSDSGSDSDDKKEVKTKLDMEEIEKAKYISNDVKEGCTVFIKNVPFDAADEDVRKVCRKFGPLYYAIVNRDRISGHSKGTAFVKFKTAESANLCLQAGTEFILMDQVLDPFPALSRDEVQAQDKEKNPNQSKDSRNLYLAREGLIMSGSKAAEGVSASDMNKRHKLEQVKTQVLKNLNRFVSRNRLSIHNLPLNYDNEKLKQLAVTFTNFKPHECRVMRENKVTPEHPQGKSKGFGFISFTTHREALTALRKLNNNPNVFGTQHRPIVAFSIEDRAVHKIKAKRKQKSKLNNPTFQEKLQRRKELRQQQRTNKGLKGNLKERTTDDKSKVQKQINKLRGIKKPKAAAQDAMDGEEEHFVGTAAKRGKTTVRMRSNKKIREQSQEHLKRVKTDKRKQKQRDIKRQHLAERRAVDRPKQGRKVERDELSHLVNKYKHMLGGSSNVGPSKPKKQAKRTKWYKD